MRRTSGRGGLCAWTVAWERPDQFGKVLSHIGSFVNIRGGHVYPALIRKTERKPIRVFLQDVSEGSVKSIGNSAHPTPRRAWGARD